MEEYYKVSVSVKDISIDLESHDKEWLEKKISEFKIHDYLEGKQTIIAKKEEKTSVQNIDSVSKNKYSSKVEFYKNIIKEKKITSRPDIATFFVYYLEKIQKQEQVTSSDIKGCFREIGYPNWNGINIADSLGKAKKKAFLNNVNDLWSLTITGEDFVLNTISE
jgi:hypothetical protein